MTIVSDQAEVVTGSLYQDGVQVAFRHKWIESEKHGHDIGEAAIKEWFGKYWLKHCRVRRIEHVIGNRRWMEFQDGPSELLLALYEANDLLFDLILDRVSHGWENLDIIVWAQDWGLPRDQVFSILLELNINCARLEPRFS